MGAISLEKSAQMYWLGRYMERVFVTLQNGMKTYDKAIEAPTTAYVDYCNALGMADIYGSSEVFFEKYLYDDKDCSSVAFSLERAFDNAIVLRNEISTDSLAYIHLAQEKLAESVHAEEKLIVLQGLLDYIYAFWGSVEDLASNQQTRINLKSGKYQERLDLYVRLEYPYEEVLKTFRRLEGRVDHVGLPYSTEILNEMRAIIATEEEWSKPGNPQQFLHDLTNLFFGAQFN